MDKIGEIVQKCIQDLKKEGIPAELVRMFGAQEIEAIITLPQYRIRDNTVSKENVNENGD